MKAICTQDIIIDHHLFEEGGEYEFEESYVRYQPTEYNGVYRICKAYNIKTGFFSHITGYSEEAFILTFGDRKLSRECGIPCFDDYFEKL